MKNVTRVLAVVLVAVVLCGVLASCGTTLSGKYKADAVVAAATYEFKGSKFTYTTSVLGVSTSISGTYKIKDDKITFTVTDGEDKENKTNGTFDFKKNDDGSITIGILTYTKA